MRAFATDMRLASGVLWPMPITLDVTEEFAKKLTPGSSKVALRDPEGVMLAVLHVEEVWQPDRAAEAKAVFNSTSKAHPGADYAMNNANPWYVGGRVEGLQMPSHYDFRTLRLTPAELRAEFARLGWRRVVAFQTRNPMHRAHVGTDFPRRQASRSQPSDPSCRRNDQAGRRGLLHARALLSVAGSKYPQGTQKLSLLPLAMRMGGPREAIWHALIRKNHGCTHFIVGRDHAGPGKDTDGKPFYGPYEAQEVFKKHESDIGVTMVPFNMMVYLEGEDRYVPDDEVKKGDRVLNISGTELRQRLNEGRDIPGWFTYPEVVHELRRSFPPRSRQGVTIFFTGLVGFGQVDDRECTADEVPGSRRASGDACWMATWCASIFRRSWDFRKSIATSTSGASAMWPRRSPRTAGSRSARPSLPTTRRASTCAQMVEPVGGFILVHIATPVEVCEQRDRKGLYAKARAGILKEFTGISDPYEAPADAEVTINTGELSPEEAAQEIILHLEREGFIGVNGAAALDTTTES